MATYKLRFFFDWGGNCLWAENAAAVEKFGYPVELQSLGLPISVLELADKAYGLWLANFSRGIQVVTEEGRASFNQAALSLCKELQQRLGADFEISNEMDT